MLSSAIKTAGWKKKTGEQQIRFIEKSIEIAKARARTTIRIESRKTKQPVKTFEQIK